MSKLSFRARALDPSKPMPIFLAEELPDLPEYSAINRAVPQMPSGMEKEEESEHHLQRAICTGLIIPTPEVFDTEQNFYDRCYPPDYKMPKQYIHMQPLAMEQDIPDYDMDSSDETWVTAQSRRLDLSPFKFEQMMDRLEKSSGQTVVTLNEAKALLKQDDEVSIAVYDYWLNKRLKTQHPLILSVKTENRPGTAQNNPYLAFRRRTEKMQTRKNRKNDESSYEKMLKLRRDLSRAVTLLEMIKRREKAKREQLHLGIEIFEKRYQSRDFSGQLLAEFATTVAKNSRPAFAPIYPNQYSHSTLPSSTPTSVTTNQWPNSGPVHHYTASQYLSNTVQTNKRDVEVHVSSTAASRKEKRQYKKRKHKSQRDKPGPYVNPAGPSTTMDVVASSEEEEPIGVVVGAEPEEDGLFAFRRNKFSQYYKPISSFGNWPWTSKLENGSADPKYRFTLTSIRHPKPRCIGFSRRRVGRGGRIILDRASTNMDDIWSSSDYTIFDSEITSSIKTTKSSFNSNIKMDKDDLVGSTTTTTTTEAESCRKVVIDKKELVVVDDLASNIVINKKPNNYTDSILYDKQKHLSGGLSEQQMLIQNSCSGGGSNIINVNNNLNRTNNCKNVINLNDSNSSSSNNSNSIGISGSSNNLLLLQYQQQQQQLQQQKLQQQNSNQIVDIKKEIINDEFDKILLASNNLGVNNSILSNLNNSTTHVKNEFDILSQHNSSSGVSSMLSSGLSIGGITNTFSQDSLLNVLSNIKVEPGENSTNNISSFMNTMMMTTTATTTTMNPTATTISTTPSLINDDDDSDDPFMEEVRRSWLHFRPKTPPPPLSPPASDESRFDLTESTPLSIELQTLNNSILLGIQQPPSSTIFLENHDNLFLSNVFSLSDIMDDPPSQLLSTSSISNLLDNSTASVTTTLNSSGDSLTDINLSLDDQILTGNDDNEKFLDNILKECQIDDLKQFHTNTNFWNGILEDTGLLSGLDIMEDNKQIDFDKIGYNSEFVNSNVIKSGDKKIDDVGVSLNTTTVATTTTTATTKRRKLSSNRMGHSSFIVTNLSKDNNNLFKKDVAGVAAARLSNNNNNNNIVVSSGDCKSDLNLSDIDLMSSAVIPSLVASPHVGGGTTVASINSMFLQNSATAIQTTQAHTTQFFDKTSGENMYVLQTPIRKHVNGPQTVDRNAIQTMFKQAINVRKLPNLQTNSKPDDNSTEMKPRECYVKLPIQEFKQITSNNLAAINTNHNYSLSPNTIPQSIILTGQHQSQQLQQQQQQHNKVIINTSSNAHQQQLQQQHVGGGTTSLLSNTSNITLTTPVQEFLTVSSGQQKQIHLNTIPTSNIKLNLVSTSNNNSQQYQHQQARDVKHILTSSGLHSGSIDEMKSFVAAGQQQQQQQIIQQQQHQQLNKNNKTVNMLYDSDKNRILYTNIKNSRGGTQFLAQLNPKVVNILPMQQHNKNNLQNASNVQTVVGVSSTTAAAASSSPNIINRNQSIQRISTQAIQGNILRTQTNSGGGGGGVSVVTNTGVVSSGLVSSIGSGDNNSNLNKILLNNDSPTTVTGININTTNR